MIYLIVIGMLVLLVLLSVNKSRRENFAVENKVPYMGSSLSNDLKVDIAPCSVSCCQPIGYTPYPITDDPRVGDNYMPTNFTCSGTALDDNGAGCSCLSKELYDYLGSRGGNL